MKPSTLLPHQLNRALDQLGGRWSLWLFAVLEASDGSTFGELASEPGLSRRVLTERLRSMEASGFVERKRYEERPPRFRYRLTPRGSQLNRLTLAMLQSASGSVIDDRRVVAPSIKPADVHPATRLLRSDTELAQAIFRETVEPLVRYDRQYGTQLIETLSTFLELDANVGATAARMYAHRHTIRYRLDRTRELTGLDIDAVHDRERLTLGLRALRMFEREGQPVDR